MSYYNSDVSSSNAMMQGNFSSAPNSELKGSMLDPSARAFVPNLQGAEARPTGHLHADAKPFVPSFLTSAPSSHVTPTPPSIPFAPRFGTAGGDLAHTNDVPLLSGFKRSNATSIRNDAQAPVPHGWQSMPTTGGVGGGVPPFAATRPHLPIPTGTFPPNNSLGRQDDAPPPILSWSAGGSRSAPNQRGTSPPVVSHSSNSSLPPPPVSTTESPDLRSTTPSYIPPSSVEKNIAPPYHSSTVPVPTEHSLQPPAMGNPATGTSEPSATHYRSAPTMSSGIAHSTYADPTNVRRPGSTPPTVSPTPGEGSDHPTGILATRPPPPKSWRPPQFGRRATPTNANPLVILLFGCRGSGKTTQSLYLAKRYGLLSISSGTLYKDGKQPYAELRTIAKEHFGPEATNRSYNGIVLDRFVATGEMDAYYIQSALSEGGLPVPFVFWLQVDPQEGMQRAESRGDNKAGADHWRNVEQRAQSEVADRVYKKIGCLYVVDCNEQNVGQVSEHIAQVIDGVFLKRSRYIRLPHLTPVAGDTRFELISNHEQFTALAREIHVTVGNVSGRIDTAPLSSIGGYVDRRSFEVSSERRHLSSMYVTLKVDGERFLVVKHATYGILGFPFTFAGCFDFSHLFDGFRLPAAEPGEGGKTKGEMVKSTESTTRNRFYTVKSEKETSIEWMLDTELTSTAADGKQGATLYIIDYVYFDGRQGKRVPFWERYERLTSWFNEVKPRGEGDMSLTVQLKVYRPINQLKELLPRLEDSPISIDGVVFQSNSVYKYGLDKALLKWKPKELCTADFRLMGGRQTSSGEWNFDLHTTDTTGESAYPNAIGVFTTMEVEGYQLRNSIIVELMLDTVSAAGTGTTVPTTRWLFHRLRTDKPRPNKTLIVKEIISMEHLTYGELLKLCSELKFTGAL